jgi:cell wall-associated NlpC family hydrolase
VARRRGFVALVLGLVVLATTLPAQAQTAPSPSPVPGARGAMADPRAAEAVEPALARLQAAVDAVVASEGAQADAAARLLQSRQIEAAAQGRLRAADAGVDTERRSYADLGAASYVRHGNADTRDRQVMVGAMTARRAKLQAALTEQAAASDAYQRALEVREADDRAAAAAEADRVAAETARQEAEGAADAAMVAVGATDLPAIAYLAYRRAADAANAADPACKLPAAVLAAYGRLHWTHGRPSPTAVQVAPARPPAGDPQGPYDLEPAALPVATQLCSGEQALDQHAPLQAALFAIEQDSAKVDIVLAAARRYARTPGLVLGDVPADPYVVADGVPQFDDGSPPLAVGDVQGMIDWAMTRLGTPYSQCLGPEARPQDPICPPGTNRFGVGFFDCSGFVSSAYRRIGITVPTTTYAMEADPRFMATKVASGFDLALLLPGDVFLMDGHTGMYVGGGQIIHASGGGLTLEPVPRWVAHATFALLRPADLVGTAPAPPPPA